MRPRLVVATLVLTIVVLGCAVRPAHAPQLNPQTVWELNVATQLQQLERDYRTFFTDVGNAQRQGPGPLFTPAQLDQLNAIGNRLKPAIENANVAYKTYRLNPTDTQRQVVIGLLSAAQRILLELSTQRSAILNGGK